MAWRILCIVLPSPLAHLEHIPCGLYPCHYPCIGNSISWTLDARFLTSFTTGVTGKLAAFNIVDAETVCIILGLVLRSLGRAEAPYYIDFLVRYTGVTLISGHGSRFFAPPCSLSHSATFSPPHDIKRQICSFFSSQETCYFP